ncbi:MAG: exodeoxyribonuclease VII small subunit [Candidatus Woesebacteria bacterium]|nr:exodeoxyribonuclease VII small subunit [Candidatus Woesebacteria bacterium]
MADDKKKEQTLTESFSELEGIAEEFERGDIDLEQGIPKFKRGLELARQLKTRLGEIENEIKEIKDEFKDLEEPANTQEVESTPEPEPESEKDDSEQIPF